MAAIHFQFFYTRLGFYCTVEIATAGHKEL